MESMASVRLRLSLRLMLRLILPSSTLFLLSAPMDTLLFPLSAVWLEPLVWLEQLAWLAPLVLSTPMATPLSPLLSRLWSLASMAMAFTESESMASVMLRLMLSPMSMDIPSVYGHGIYGVGVYGKRDAEADPYFYNGVYGGIGHYGGVYGYPYSGVHYGVYGKREA